MGLHYTEADRTVKRKRKPKIRDWILGLTLKLLERQGTKPFGDGGFLARTESRQTDENTVILDKAAVSNSAIEALGVRHSYPVWSQENERFIGTHTFG